MAEQEAEPGRCVPCEIAWNVLTVLSVLAVAFIAYDTFSNGQATEYVKRLAARARPALAQVIPISDEAGGDGASDAG